MPTTTYAERFARNTELIHAYAGDNSPRMAEITHLYAILKRLKAKNVLNVPFEGNLVNTIARSEEITFADFVVPETLQAWNILHTDYELTGISLNHFDAVLSIAGIHHLTDQEQFRFITAIRRVLRKGGRLLMVEVKSRSSTSRFLDTFVGRYTPTGHVGNYLKNDFVRVLARAGYRRTKRETVTHEWVFDSEEHLYTWMTRFFGISVSKPILIRHVGEILGMKRDRDRLRINWKLDFVTAQA
jgi:SAM-dependent methyltransferase